MQQQVVEKKLRDPRAEKIRDHRKYYKTRLGKERKEIRKVHFRTFRRKNANYCNLVLKNINEAEQIAEPIFKKTGGRITW